MKKLMTIVVAIIMALFVSNAFADTHPLPPDEPVASPEIIADTAADDIVPDDNALLFKSRPVLRGFRAEDGALAFCVEGCGQTGEKVLYALYQGKGFPKNTQSGIAEVGTPTLYMVTYKLPGETKWRPITSGMITTATDVGTRRAKLTGNHFSSDPDGTEYKWAGGKLFRKVPKRKTWEEVEARIEVYTIPVYDPHHPKKKIGEHFVIINKDTGESIILKGKFTGIMRTIRYIGGVAGVCVIVGLCVFWL